MSSKKDTDTQRINQSYFIAGRRASLRDICEWLEKNAESYKINTYDWDMKKWVCIGIDVNSMVEDLKKFFRNVI